MYFSGAVDTTMAVKALLPGCFDAEYREAKLIPYLRDPVYALWSRLLETNDLSTFSRG